MKKNTLFKDKEMGTIQQETLRLYEPSKDTIKFYKKIFSHYTVPELKKWANNIMPLLKNKKIEVLSADERPLPHSEIEYILAKRSAQNKADLEVFLTYFMADKRNMEHYIRTLSEKDVLLYKQVIKNLYCSQEALP